MYQDFFQADKVRRFIFRFFSILLPLPILDVATELFQSLRKPKLIRDVSFGWSGIVHGRKDPIRNLKALLKTRKVG